MVSPSFHSSHDGHRNYMFNIVWIVIKKDLKRPSNTKRTHKDFYINSGYHTSLELYLILMYFFGKILCAHESVDMYKQFSFPIKIKQMKPATQQDAEYLIPSFSTVAAIYEKEVNLSHSLNVVWEKVVWKIKKISNKNCITFWQKTIFFNSDYKCIERAKNLYKNFKHRKMVYKVKYNKPRKNRNI